MLTQGDFPRGGCSPAASLQGNESVKADGSHGGWRDSVWRPGNSWSRAWTGLPMCALPATEAGSSAGAATATLH